MNKVLILINVITIQEIYYIIKVMAKKKLQDIKITLLSISETLYRFNYDYDYSILDSNDLRIDFAHNFKSNDEACMFEIEIKAKYKCKENVLPELGVLTSFIIDPYSEFIVGKNEEGFSTNIPEILEKICSISLGILRGVFFSKLKGTPLEKYPIPLIPIDAIIPQIKKE